MWDQAHASFNLDSSRRDLNSNNCFIHGHTNLNIWNCSAGICIDRFGGGGQPLILDQVAPMIEVFIILLFPILVLYWAHCFYSLGQRRHKPINNPKLQWILMPQSSKPHKSRMNITAKGVILNPQVTGNCWLKQEIPAWRSNLKFFSCFCLSSSAACHINVLWESLQLLWW